MHTGDRRGHFATCLPIPIIRTPPHHVCSCKKTPMRAHKHNAFYLQQLHLCVQIDGAFRRVDQLPLRVLMQKLRADVRCRRITGEQKSGVLRCGFFVFSAKYGYNISGNRPDFCFVLFVPKRMTSSMLRYYYWCYYRLI